MESHVNWNTLNYSWRMHGTVYKVFVKYLSHWPQWSDEEIQHLLDSAILAYPSPRNGRAAWAVGIISRMTGVHADALQASSRYKKGNVSIVVTMKAGGVMHDQLQRKP